MVKRKVSSLAVVVFALGCLASPTAWGQSGTGGFCTSSGGCMTGDICVPPGGASGTCIPLSGSERDTNLRSHYEKDAQERQ